MQVIIKVLINLCITIFTEKLIQHLVVFILDHLARLTTNKVDDELVNDVRAAFDIPVSKPEEIVPNSEVIQPKIEEEEQISLPSEHLLSSMLVQKMSDKPYVHNHE